MSLQGLRGIIGKRIKGMIVSQGNKAGPDDQLMLIFDDDTHFELFGISLGWSSRVSPGGSDAAMKSIGDGGGTITQVEEELKPERHKSDKAAPSTEDK